MTSTGTATGTLARPQARRSAPSRVLVVEEYVGRPANQAAQAVRRAGLKPGLERAFDCAEELVGQVVAQEPQPGAELARNGLVTLFIAAPHAIEDCQQNQAEPEPRARHEWDPTPRARAEARPASSHDALGPRRKKRGQAHGAARSFPLPPAPTLPPTVLAGGAARQDTGYREADAPLLRDERVADACRLFDASATAPSAWRLPIGRRELRRLIEHRRWSFRIALALVTIWLLVGIASALDGGGQTSRRRQSLRPLAAAAHAPPNLGDSTRAAPAPAPRERPRARQTRFAQASRNPLGQRASRNQSAAKATAEHAGAAPRSAQPRPVSSPAEPTGSATNAEGGPFSP